MIKFCSKSGCWRASANAGLCRTCSREFEIPAPHVEESPAPSEQPWMLTKSGAEVDLLNPKPDQIRIEDIAWGLSSKPRFNGHTVPEIRYSVAQHCCLCYDRMQETTDDWRSKLWALLHDATEAYLPDVHSLLKNAMPGFRDLENKFEKAIADRYGLGPKPSLVKLIDLRLLATERRDLMHPNKRPWAILKGINPYNDKIVPWNERTSYQEFLFRYTECVKRMPL